MKHQIKTIIFITVLIICSNLKGQTEYEPGYIINNQNDTIFGEINYGLTNNFHHCVFKVQGNKTENKYLPGEIKAYSFTSSNRYFISKELPLGDSLQNVFAEVLVDGIANLYYYGGELENKYFIEKNDGEIQGLTSTDKIITKDCMKYQVSDNKHVGTLLYFLSDCDNSKLKNRINNAELRHKSLINITENYHKYACESDEECIVYSKKRQPEFSFGVYAGYLNNFYDMREAMYPYYSPEFHKSNSFIYGILFSLKPNFWNNKLSLSYNTDLSTNIYKEDSNSANFNFLQEGYVRALKITTWQNAFLFKYNILHDSKLSPFIKSGLKISYQYNVLYDLYPEYPYNDDSEIVYDDVVNPPASQLIYGVEGGVGLDYNIFYKFIVFIYASFSYQTGGYNSVTGLSIRSGISF